MNSSRRGVTRPEPGQGDWPTPDQEDSCPPGPGSRQADSSDYYVEVTECSSHFRAIQNRSTHGHPVMGRPGHDPPPPPPPGDPEDAGRCSVSLPHEKIAPAFRKCPIALTCRHRRRCRVCFPGPRVRTCLGVRPCTFVYHRSSGSTRASPAPDTCCTSPCARSQLRLSNKCSSTA